MTDKNELYEEYIRQSLKRSNPVSMVKLIWKLIKSLFTEKPELIIFSSVILILLWGYHGNLDLLKFIIKDWSPPGDNTSTRTTILHWVLWDRELISFWLGAFLLVFIPMLIIRYGFKHSLRDYGLAFPLKENRSAGWKLFILLIVVSIFPFYMAAKNEGMQQLYPFYKQFRSTGEFLVYELTYFPFFLAIEFIFRGYLLLGLSRDAKIVYNPSDASTVTSFGKHAILISMLSYTAWHLGKPLTELWGTPVWGLLAGAGTYYVRSIWPVLMAHFLLNVFLDGMILHNLHLFPG